MYAGLQRGKKMVMLNGVERDRTRRLRDGAGTPQTAHLLLARHLETNFGPVVAASPEAHHPFDSLSRKINNDPERRSHLQQQRLSSFRPMHHGQQHSDLIREHDFHGGPTYEAIDPMPGHLSRYPSLTRSFLQQRHTHTAHSHT